MIDRVATSLEAAQKDLGSIGSSLGIGVSDLRKDAQRLLHDAERDLKKMREASQRDIERLQKDLSKAAAAKDGHARKTGTHA